MRPHGQKWIRNTTRLAIYARDGFRCVYAVCCDGRDVPSLLQLDHVSPGRDNSPENLVTCCLECNEWKGQRTLDALLESLADGVLARRIRRDVARQTFLPIDRALGRYLEQRRPRGAFAQAALLFRRKVA